MGQRRAAERQGRWTAEAEAAAAEREREIFIFAFFEKAEIEIERGAVRAGKDSPDSPGVQPTEHARPSRLYFSFSAFLSLCFFFHCTTLCAR